jgi:hypothetical protein
MIMVTGQQPCSLEGQPAFGLEICTLGTGAMPARVVPDTGDVTVGARLDMTAQGGRPALHDGVCGSAYVDRQGMALFIGWKGVLEDRLERDERHRCLRTRGRRLSLGGFLQYHAHHPRDKRLVQPGIIGNTPGAAWLTARVSCFQINGMLLIIGTYKRGVPICIC